MLLYRHSRDRQTHRRAIIIFRILTGRCNLYIYIAYERQNVTLKVFATDVIAILGTEPARLLCCR